MSISASYSVLLLSGEKALAQRPLTGDSSALDVSLCGPLDDDGDVMREVYTATSCLLAKLGVPGAVDIELRFATVLEAPPQLDGNGLPSFEWIFFADLPANAAKAATEGRSSSHGVLLAVACAELEQDAYTERYTPRLGRIAQTFLPLRAKLQRAAKRCVPPVDLPLDELQDYHLLSPCYYVFDKPGKGVRSKSVRALSSLFRIDRRDLDSLMQCIDRYHELSLIIDDIEDDSILRRDRECAHLLYGTPLTMNSAYFMTFKLLDSVPRLFRRHHADTVKLIVDGTVKAHRGQGLELYWRDNHICPTEEEYVQMVRGKTSTPFLLAAQLFFLHADDIRLSAVRFAQPWMNRIADLAASTLGEPIATMLRAEGVEEKVMRLFDLTGVFFQIRDDYINLVDPDYWRKKGFCDDIHERKFSYPIIHMIRQRKGQYQKILQLYNTEVELTDADLDYALDIILDTDALQQTYEYLKNMQDRLYALADELYFKPFHAILDRLQVTPPTGARRDALLAESKLGKSPMTADKSIDGTAVEVEKEATKVCIPSSNGHLVNTNQLLAN